MTDFIHDLMVSLFGEEAMRHPIFGPCLHCLGSMADAIGMVILALTGVHMAQAGDVAPDVMVAQTPAPTSFPSLFTSNGIITWIIIGGGSVWLIRQLGELVNTVIFKARSGWITAAAGTDHQRADDCEKQRLVQEQAINNLRNEITAAWSVSRLKDKNIEALDARIDRLEERLGEKDQLIRQQHDELLGLSQNVSQNNAKLIENVVHSPKGTATDPTIVKMDPNAEPVPVREVGHAGPVGEGI